MKEPIELEPEDAAREARRLKRDPRWRAWRKQYRKAVADLNAVVEDMQDAGFVGTNLYLESGSLNLMVCESHIGRYGKAVHQGVVDAPRMNSADGGGW